MESKTLLLFLFLFFLFLSQSSFTFSGGDRTAADLIEELVALRARSPSGVIHLDDRSVARFLTSVPTPRPYSLLIFFDAAQLRSKAELHLPKFHSEFALLSAAFSSRNPDSSALFFCDIEFSESQHSFHEFGVSSLPHIRFVAADHASLKDSEAMDQSHFSRLAESMAEFVESRTSLKIGPIAHPPPVSNKQFALVIIALLAASPFMIKKVIEGNTLFHDRKVWMSLSVFVYFFSVSGAMYNIIRKMPMFLPDRQHPTKIVFFYQGSGMQLGAEGFAVGSLYTVVGLLLAAMTHLLVRVKNANAQRGFMLVAIVVAYWAVSKVIYLDNWKTGYRIHAFWPSNWN